MLQTTKGLPEFCEYCCSKLKWDSVHLVCSNPSCSHKDNQKLKTWIMNLAPVKGIGWTTIEKAMASPFYTNNHTRFNVESLMNRTIQPIPNVKFGYGELGGWNEVLYKLQNDNFTVSQFLLALNIPGLGKIGAKAFEDYPNCVDLLDKISRLKYDVELFSTLSKIFQDKSISYALLYDYNNHFKTCYNLVKDRLVNDSKAINNGIKHIGNVVVTGKLSVKRSDFERFLNNCGFKLTSTVNKETMYLITDDPNSGTSKNKKADELGVAKITEDDFRAKYHIN